MLILLPSGPILAGVIRLINTPRWQRFEQRRQAAVSPADAASHLAAEQPAPDERALPLPFTIKMGPSLRRIIIVVGCFMVLFNGYFFAITYYLITPNPSFFIPVDVILTIGSFLLFTILFFITLRQRIEITEQGITIDSLIVQRIRWQDVRLFAMLSANLLSERDTGTGGYELSGPRTIVRWTRLSRTHFSLFRFMMKPALPFDEYDRQMDALLSLIAAKTGLPLYDLR